MLDYKIELHDEVELQEALELFIKLGYCPYQDYGFYLDHDARFFFAEKNKFPEMCHSNYYPVEWCPEYARDHFDNSENIEITIMDLYKLVLDKFPEVEIVKVVDKTLLNNGQFIEHKPYFVNNKLTGFGDDYYGIYNEDGVLTCVKDFVNWSVDKC